jgi:hypothetical protein
MRNFEKRLETAVPELGRTSLWLFGLVTAVLLGPHAELWQRSGLMICSGRWKSRLWTLSSLVKNMESRQLLISHIMYIDIN